MERIVYDRMAELDTRHWWYRARRDVLASLIARRIARPVGARILEVGCGTGHNLPMLGGFGTVDAVELDPVARDKASQRLGKPVIDARLPELAGVEAGAYDLVASLDVVEHVEDDVAALKALAACLKPGGKLLITVPAFPFLWSAHDVTNHHHRRYTRATLRGAIEGAGLKTEFMGWFNSLLFPLAVADRMWGKMTGREGSDDALPPAPLNALFQTIFGLERYALGALPLPPGVSLAAVLSA